MLDSGQVEQRFPLSFNFHLTEMVSHICGVQQWAGECYSLRGGRILVTMWGELWHLGLIYTRTWPAERSVGTW